jgi:hypothetical protein
MATNTDTAGITTLYSPQLALCLISNSHRTPFHCGDQEFWEYVGVDPETALAIAQGFPDHWHDVEAKDARFPRAANHRRKVLPQLANATIPLPPLSNLRPEEIEPTFQLLEKMGALKPDRSDAETQYARYPFAILHELHPPSSPEPSHEEWQALLGDLFRLLYRSGHGHLHPDAVREEIPKRWIIHNSPRLQRFREIDALSKKMATPWNKMVRWFKRHLTGNRSG